MQISENVVKDLLPIYMAGEASPETVQLVEEFLARHPELRALVSLQPDAALPEMEIPGGLEHRSLTLTRRLLSRKQWLLGAAILLSLAPLSFAHIGSRQYFLFRDAPMAAALALAAGLGSWLLYLDTCRRLNHTGLQAPRSWSVRMTWYGVGAALGALTLLVGSHLAGVQPWSPLRIWVPLGGGLLAVWLGEKLNRVASIEELHKPTSLFGK
jgi:hypothetical protein